MIHFQLQPSSKGESFIELNKLLKATRLVESGAVANQLITLGKIKVNGEIDTRKRAKIYKGFMVEFGENQIIVE